MLQLVFVVLEKDGVEETAESRGEQVLLALEFLSIHANSCMEARIDWPCTSLILFCSF